MVQPKDGRGARFSASHHTPPPTIASLAHTRRLLPTEDLRQAPGAVRGTPWLQIGGCATCASLSQIRTLDMYDLPAFPPEDIQIIEYSNAATLVFLVWEACITFSDEVDFIWSSTRVRWAKAAHLVLRYYTIIVLFLTQITWDPAVCDALRLCTMPACLRWYGQSFSLEVIIALQQFLMASRVYALYGRRRRIFWVLVLSFAAEHSIMLVCTILTMHDTAFAELCEPLYIPPVGAGVGLAPLMYDLLLLVLTVRACLHTAWRRTPLLALLFQDGVWAFLAVFGVFVLEFIFFGVIRGPLASAAWSWQFVGCSCTAGRVVLHMHTEGGVLPSRQGLVPTDQFALTTVAPEPDRGSEEW